MVEDLGPLPKFHTRDDVVGVALLDMADAFESVRTKHGLSSAEFAYVISRCHLSFFNGLLCKERFESQHK